MSDVFDPGGDLPRGTTVLEASAGTGKTYTIAALAARYVAEGVAELPQILFVTFGRAATGELRDRVRERLVSARRALDDPTARTGTDQLVAQLAAVDDDELSLRRERLARAVARFDAATIATTHGFCQQMLTALGVSGDMDPGAVLVPDVSDLVEEVVDDLYLQRYADTADPVLTPAQAREVARAAVGDPLALIGPAADPHTPAGHRTAFARAARDLLRERKRAGHILDYDDLLIMLRDALAHPEHGSEAARRVRAPFRVVLVDEFQDTDPVQWQILRAAFHGHTTLVLIGDPKQAIYAFRGGDVVSYLAARSAAQRTDTLGRCWRSDEPLLTALRGLLGGAALGDPRIRVLPVQAARQGRRLEPGPALRLRQVTRAALGVGTRDLPPVARVRELVCADVAADVVRRLQTGRIVDDDGVGRAVEPADLAVLTRRNADADRVRSALAGCGVPAVVSGLASVFGSAAAGWWSTLLTALEHPGDPGRVAAVALTPFVGWDAARLAGAADAERDDLADRIRVWARVLGERGVAALQEAAAQQGLAERLLRTDTGERSFTDLRHVGQSLHLAAVADHLGVAALTDWLRRRVEEADHDSSSQRSRRLETDRAAVSVVTVHASKGLEFPVVYVPFAWDRFESETPPLLRYHDESGARLLHLGGRGSPDYDAARERHLAEDRGEDLRLLYVALTRARSQVVLWWAPSRNSWTAPLTRILLGRPEPPAAPGTGWDPADRVPPAGDRQVSEAFDRLAGAAGGTIAVEPVTGPPAPVRWRAPVQAVEPLSVATLTRGLDAGWRRTSYTGLTRDSHADRYAGADPLTGFTSTGDSPAQFPAADPRTVGSIEHGDPDGPGVSSEPDVRAVTDEVTVHLPPGDPGELVQPGGPGGPGVATAVVSPMAQLPGGAAFGTLVHAVLERVDAAAPDLDAEVGRRCLEQGADRFPGVDAEVLGSALSAVLSTPLGPFAPGLALCDVTRSDRLSELEFELPLAGGDTASSTGPVVGRIGDLLARHLGAADPYRPYADRLRAAGFAGTRLRGYLTGSLDAVLRVPSADRGHRYLVVDYKTNRLAAVGESLTAWHYRPAAMVEAMMEADYPLQLLLYLVALHRFLTWRQPGYDPARHLGGGLYLFVRGMCGPRTPVLDPGGAPAGVAAWCPPAAAVVELSALLDGSDPSAGPT